MFFVVIRRRGAEWNPQLPMELQSEWPEHAAYMDQLVNAGIVVLGGPLADEERVVLAIDADSEEAIRGMLAEDPWNGSHLVIDSIDEWTIRLDGRGKG